VKFCTNVSEIGIDINFAGEKLLGSIKLTDFTLKQAEFDPLLV